MKFTYKNQKQNIQSSLQDSVNLTSKLSRLWIGTIFSFLILVSDISDQEKYCAYRYKDLSSHQKLD